LLGKARLQNDMLLLLLLLLFIEYAQRAAYRNTDNEHIKTHIDGDMILI